MGVADQWGPATLPGDAGQPYSNRFKLIQ
jgi:hypothetical protein